MFVEGEGFRNFVKTLQPKFIVPCRTTVARDCFKLYIEEKDVLKKLMKSQRICLTTNTWTSVQQLNYLCLTAHWIDDDWKLNKRILNFCLIPNNKGETICKLVEACLLDWGIEKIFTVIVDNSSSNDGAIRYLKTITMDWQGTILGHEFIHMRCCAHILNLIVREGMTELHESIGKIRNVVRYVRSSPARLQQFRKSVEKVKIESKSLVCLDVETRWNSTFFMLEAAEKFQKAFHRLQLDDQKFVKYFGDSGPPSSGNWDNARSFIKFLRIFYKATLSISGSLYVTSNTFFHELIHIQSMLILFSKSGDELLKSMAERMKGKFDKYWENISNINFLLYVAILLDPRYKLAYLKFGFSQIYNPDVANEMAKKVNDTLVRLHDFYINQDSNIKTPTNNVGEVTELMDVDENDAQKIMQYQFDKHMEEFESMETKSEVERYFMEACKARSDSSFDNLGWWKHNSARYVILSKIARDVLAVPVSTVASESAFSTGGRIIDPFRSTLSPKMVEALICAQNWIRSTPKPIDLQEAMEDVEKYEKIISEFEEEVSASSQPVNLED